MAAAAILAVTAVSGLLVHAQAANHNRITGASAAPVAGKVVTTTTIQPLGPAPGYAACSDFSGGYSSGGGQFYYAPMTASPMPPDLIACPTG